MTDRLVRFMRWYRAAIGAPVKRKPADSPVYTPLVLLEDKPYFGARARKRVGAP